MMKNTTTNPEPDTANTIRDSVLDKLDEVISIGRRGYGETDDYSVECLAAAVVELARLQKQIYEQSRTTENPI